MHGVIFPTTLGPCAFLSIQSQRPNQWQWMTRGHHRGTRPSILLDHFNIFLKLPPSSLSVECTKTFLLDVEPTSACAANQITFDLELTTRNPWTVRHSSALPPGYPWLWIVPTRKLWCLPSCVEGTPSITRHTPSLLHISSCLHLLCGNQFWVFPLLSSLSASRDTWDSTPSVLQANTTQARQRQVTLHENLLSFWRKFT